MTQNRCWPFSATACGNLRPQGGGGDIGSGPGVFDYRFGIPSGRPGRDLADRQAIQLRVRLDASASDLFKKRLGTDEKEAKKKEKFRDEPIDAVLRDPEQARIYWAMSRIDPETVNALRQSPGCASWCRFRRFWISTGARFRSATDE